MPNQPRPAMPNQNNIEVGLSEIKIKAACSKRQAVDEQAARIEAAQ